MSDLYLTVEVSIGAGTVTHALRQMADLAQRLQIGVCAEMQDIHCTVYYPLTEKLFQIDRTTGVVTSCFNEAWRTVLRSLGYADTPELPGGGGPE